MAASTTAKKQDHDKTTASSSETGWNAMLRYDPTKASSKQLLETSKTITTTTGRHDKESPSSSSSSSSSESEHGEKEMVHDQESSSQNDIDAAKPETLEPLISKNTTAGNVYRQDDLEHVFREARELQTNRAPVVVESESAMAVAGGFSFGFALDQQQEATTTTTKNNTSFSFGFDIASQAATAAPQQSTAPDVVNDATNDEDDDDKVPRKKRRKLHSSFEDLDKWVEAYLINLNQGQRIASDLNAFRADPAVSQEWERQRQRLTTDWKAKRKHAMARKQQHQKRHHGY